MELQEYLRYYGLKSLEDKFQIVVNRHSTFENLICLKYHQYNSPMSEKIVRQCRGIILDEADNWRIISYSFDKFFNYGEPGSAQIDWNSASVFEKLDGSLMVLYFYGGEWRVQSSSRPDASGFVGEEQFTFEELFWQIWREQNYCLPDDTNYCYSFEMMSPFNRVIVEQNRNRLVLHGVRNIKSLEEEHSHTSLAARNYNWEIVSPSFFTNINEIIEQTANLDPKLQEGFIVVDDSFNRIKVKSPLYVAIHNSASSLSLSKLLQIYLQGEAAEFLTYLPQWKNLYENMKEKIARLSSSVEKEYQKYSQIQSQKEFAIAIALSNYKPFLFKLRSGKAKTVEQCLASMSHKTASKYVEEIIPP
jgi:hypothetical protein